MLRISGLRIIKKVLITVMIGFHTYISQHSVNNNQIIAIQILMITIISHTVMSYYICRNINPG